MDTPALFHSYCQHRRVVASSFRMRRRTERITVSVLGAAATALLHSPFLTVAMWGGGMPHRYPDRPDAIGTGANQGGPEGETAERRITVQLLSNTDARPAPTTQPLLDALVLASMLEITGPDALPLPPLIIEEDGIPAESTDAELIARAKMVGIYESQIRARIERAWASPDRAIAGQAFTCRVLIRQHRDGQIKEVEVPYENCDGAPALRQSLISAIFSSSPLPAPPHPGVFVDSFSMVFRLEN